MKLWDVLEKKIIKCRYCHTLMDVEQGYDCPECGGAYKEQHWYCQFKNGGIINLWDYFEFHINPSDTTEDGACKIADFELKNRKKNK